MTQTRSASFGSRKTTRTIGSVLPALVGAGVGEDLEEAVEVLDLGCCEQHVNLLSWSVLVVVTVVRR